MKSGKKKYLSKFGVGTPPTPLSRHTRARIFTEDQWLNDFIASVHGATEELAHRNLDLFSNSPAGIVLINQWSRRIPPAEWAVITNGSLTFLQKWTRLLTWVSQYPSGMQVAPGLNQTWQQVFSGVNWGPQPAFGKR